MFLPLLHRQIVLPQVAINQSQLDMHVGEVGIHLQRLFQLFDGRVILPCVGQGLTEIALVLQVQGIEFNRAPQMG